MSVLSKQLYTIIDCRDGYSIIQSGFNTRYGEDYTDAHYWCEDEYGKIIDTTTILEDWSVSRGEGWGGGNKFYIKWDNQEKCIQEYSNPCWKNIMKVNEIPDIPELRKALLDEITESEDWKGVRRCMINAMAYQNKYKNLKVCIGSYGYKIKPGVIDLVWGM